MPQRCSCNGESRVTLAAALFLCNVVLLPQALYRLKLSHASLEQIERVQGAVRRVIARKAKLTAAHSNILFGGYMGCGWRRWRDEVGVERVKVLAMAWEEWDTTFARVMRGAVAQLQEGGDGTNGQRPVGADDIWIWIWNWI